MPDDLSEMSEDFERQLKGLPPIDRSNDKISWKLKLFYVSIFSIIILQIAYCGPMKQPTMKERCQQLTQKWGKACMLSHGEIQQCCEFSDFKYTKRCGNGSGYVECF